jgi:phage/plasmid-like protein (TIGR03299 family)
MTHNLNYNSKTEKHSFFSVREKAWHSLGTIVEDYPTSSQAIQHAGLDYIVEKRPIFTYDTQNAIFPADIDFIGEKLKRAEVEVPNFFATVRSDTDEALGVVGKDYHVVQNVDAFSFFDSIVGGGDGILYETAGALGRGERVFITAKLPDYIKVGRNDLIEQYLFLTTSHNGSGSITAAFTPVRIVCQNTLNAAMRSNANGIKIKHTANAHDRLKQAHQLMGITNQLGQEMEQLFNHWAKVRITDRQVKKLVQLAMAPNRETLACIRTGKPFEQSTLFNNTVEKVLEYAGTSPSQQFETTKGNLFGVYNSVTGYFQNVREFKTAESKFNSIMGGGAMNRAQATFELCTDFAKMGVNALN